MKFVKIMTHDHLKLKQSLQNKRQNTNSDPGLRIIGMKRSYIHSMDPYVINTVQCGTSHKYTDVQIYSVKNFEHFTKTVL